MLDNIAHETRLTYEDLVRRPWTKQRGTQRIAPRT